MNIDLVTPAVICIAGVVAAAVVGFICALNEGQARHDRDAASGKALSKAAQEVRGTKGSQRDSSGLHWFENVAAIASFWSIVVMTNGSYPLGEVEITHRQSDF